MLRLDPPDPTVAANSQVSGYQRSSLALSVAVSQVAPRDQAPSAIATARGWGSHASEATTDSASRGSRRIVSGYRRLEGVSDACQITVLDASAHQAVIPVSACAHKKR
jgi:hypothetical protein